jgi:GDP-mannose 6-dehydrogenase
LKVSIFGLGYVGCVSVGCLAQNGNEIIGVDINQSKLELLNRGKSPILEKEIDNIISKQYKLGRISATDSSVDATCKTDASFICVGTPSTTNGYVNLDSIYKVASEIADGIKKKNSLHVVVIRSTVPPGTNEKITDIITKTSEKSNGEDFAVVSNPEFLREGSAVHDFFNPPYTLIGANHQAAIKKMKEIYKGIKAPVIVTDIKIAEMIKYVNNAFHALKITFANEIGQISKISGIDSHKLMQVFCKDKKLNLSAKYLKPGFAYGGSCLPKDLRALKTIAHDNYIGCCLLDNIERSNELQKEFVLKRIINFQKRNIGFLGLSFKAGTDDLRESPIVDIIERLLGKGYNILIYDRNIRLSQLIGRNKEYILEKIPLISQFIVEKPEEMIQHSELIVVVNRDRDFQRVLKKISSSVIVYDLVNYNFEKRKHCHYEGIAW